VPPEETESGESSKRLPKDALCAKRFVELAVVAKKFVDVAFVVEAFKTASVAVDVENVNDGEPLNVPFSLNCTWVSEPPGFPVPPEPMHVPFTAKQPPARSMPPANVEVAEPETASAASVDVPLNVTPEIVPPEMLAFEIDPPEIEGFVIVVFVSWSIAFVCAVTL